MSMLGVMRGAVNIGAVFGRRRREVHSGVVGTDLTIEVQTITPLKHLKINIAMSRPTFHSLHLIQADAKTSTAGLQNIIKKMEAA